MTTNQNDETKEEILDESFNDLIKKATETTERIEKNGTIFEEELNKTKKEIEKGAKEISDGLISLDKDEQETEDELDKLILEEAENIAKEEVLDAKKDEEEKIEDKEN